MAKLKISVIDSSEFDTNLAWVVRKGPIAVLIRGNHEKNRHL